MDEEKEGTHGELVLGSGPELELGPAPLSGVLNLTRGRRRNPPLVRTITVIQIRNRNRALLMKMKPVPSKANMGLTGRGPGHWMRA